MNPLSGHGFLLSLLVVYLMGLVFSNVGDSRTPPPPHVPWLVAVTMSFVGGRLRSPQPLEFSTRNSTDHTESGQQLSCDALTQLYAWSLPVFVSAGAFYQDCHSCFCPLLHLILHLSGPRFNFQLKNPLKPPLHYPFLDCDEKFGLARYDERQQLLGWT